MVQLINERKVFVFQLLDDTVGREMEKRNKGIEIFLFAFALADVVLELGAHGLCLVEDGADIGLDGYFLLPAAHGTEWLRAGQLCGSAWVCRTVEHGM